jgi:hypothetical protein
MPYIYANATFDGWDWRILKAIIERKARYSPLGDRGKQIHIR